MDADFRGDEGRSGRVQAVPVGAVDVPQRRPVQGVGAHEDRERRAGVVLGAQVRPDAGAHQEPDARGHCGQPAEPLRDRSNTKALQVLFVRTTFHVSLSIAKRNVKQRDALFIHFH